MSSKTLTTETFIEKCKEILGEDSFDYSETVYVNCRTTLKVKCKTCDNINERLPLSLFKSFSCDFCDFIERKNKFINDAIKAHGVGTFDYENIDYISHKENITVKCNKCGESINRKPQIFLNLKICPNCKKNDGYTIKGKTDNKKFIERANLVFGEGRYDYSEVDYKDMFIPVKITCNECGYEFNSTPNNHLNGKKGCRKCASKKAGDSTRKTLEKFIEDAINVHGNSYDYSLVEYINSGTGVNIKCNECGKIFPQKPTKHINAKQGCPYCAPNKIWDKIGRITTEDFIKRSKELFGENTFDYSNTNYTLSREPLLLKCKKHDHEFDIKPNKHLSRFQGCPICSAENHLSETRLKNDLIKYLPNEKIIHQISFDWLGRQSIDLYFPEYNIGVEYQGVQHFRGVDFFGGHESFVKTRELDIKKFELCSANKLDLLYFTYDFNDIVDFPYPVYSDIDKLVEYIKSKIN